MIAISWPDDWVTALGILVFVLIVLWWRHRFPKRYDFTLHLDLKRDDPNQDAQKPPAE